MNILKERLDLITLSVFLSFQEKVEDAPTGVGWGMSSKS